VDIFLQIGNSPPLFIGAAVLFGLAVGSFLNVVIHRLPKMLEREWKAQCLEYLGSAAPQAAQPAESAQPVYNLVLPRSGCPSCGHSITVLENIPIFSYLFLKGRCSACGTRISVRYPIVEALTGVLSGYIAWRFGFTLAVAFALVLCWALIALTFIDADTQLLPDDITLPLLWIGLIANLGGTFTDLKSAILGAVLGYLALWAVYWCFKIFTGKEGMGYGDFKLLAALGAWLGWQMLPLIILLSAAVGAVVGIVGILIAGRGREARIPYGPYLAAAGFIALLWGRNLNEWYLGFPR
jgi:leader peptidase (prepilin peptidase)/N-methyltransferase